MADSINSQVIVFLYAVAGGMAVAFIYDLFSIKKRKPGSRSIIIGITDVLYWIIAAFVLFTIVLVSNDGELRGYVFIGAALGTVLYAVLLRRPLMRVFSFFTDILYKVGRAVFMAFAYPVKLLFRLIRRPLSAIGRFLKRMGGKAVRTGRYGLNSAAWRFRLLNNIMKKK